jgi:hypothetical protein
MIGSIMGGSLPSTTQINLVQMNRVRNISGPVDLSESEIQSELRVPRYVWPAPIRFITCKTLHAGEFLASVFGELT